jgi:hypothetical protein
MTNPASIRTSVMGDLKRACRVGSNYLHQWDSSLFADCLFLSGTPRPMYLKFCCISNGCTLDEAWARPVGA